MYLEEIVGRDILEGVELECKARLNRDDVEGWLKSVAGFANAQGGHLYIGVEDKSSKLIGFTRAQADSERNFFNGQINQHVSPRPPYKVDFVRYRNGERELNILDVTIFRSTCLPTGSKSRHPGASSKARVSRRRMTSRPSFRSDVTSSYAAYS